MPRVGQFVIVCCRLTVTRDLLSSAWPNNNVMRGTTSNKVGKDKPLKKVGIHNMLPSCVHLFHDKRVILPEFYYIKNAKQTARPIYRVRRLPQSASLIYFVIACCWFLLRLQKSNARWYRLWGKKQNKNKGKISLNEMSRIFLFEGLQTYNKKPTRQK
jgi:hypothetical protein